MATASPKQAPWRDDKPCPCPSGRSLFSRDAGAVPSVLGAIASCPARASPPERLTSPSREHTGFPPCDCSPAPAHVPGRPRRGSSGLQGVRSTPCSGAASRPRGCRPLSLQALVELLPRWPRGRRVQGLRRPNALCARRSRRCDEHRAPSRGPACGKAAHMPTVPTGRPVNITPRYTFPQEERTLRIDYSLSNFQTQGKPPRCPAQPTACCSPGDSVAPGPASSHPLTPHPCLPPVRCHGECGGFGFHTAASPHDVRRSLTSLHDVRKAQHALTNDS